MRTQEQILADIAQAHRQYFIVLGDHTPFMSVLATLRRLEAELVEAVGNRHDAFHLEHVSYMKAMDDFMYGTRGK